MVSGLTHIGITDIDWKTLMNLGADPARVQDALNRWVETGYITPLQAGDIWDELDKRLTAGYLGAIYPPPAEEPEEVSPTEREFQQFWAWTETKYTPEEVRTLKGKPDIHRSDYWQYWQAEVAPSRPTYQPSPRYEPAFEELRTGFEVPQTERWKDWFRSKYPRLVEQFEAKLPELERVSIERGKVAEAEREKSWAEYLRTRKPQIREEWYKLRPYERGEYPSRYAPRLQTVGF